MNGPKTSPSRLIPVLLAAFATIAWMPAAAAAAPAPAEQSVRAGTGDDAVTPDQLVARKKKRDDEQAVEGKGPGGPGGGPGGKKTKSFKDAVKGFEKHEGLFTVYTKDDEAYLEIKPDQYDKTHLVTLTRTHGIGQFFPLLGNQQMWNAPFQLHKVGKNVQFIFKNFQFHAEGNKPMMKAVERSFSDSLFTSAKLASEPHPDTKADLIKISDLVLLDAAGVGPMLGQAIKSPYKLDKGNSSLGRIKTFPQNIEVEAILHFSNPAPKANIATLLDTRSFFLRYNYSFSSLPDDDFVPRLADDRVGHFVTAFGDFSDDSEQSPYNRFVARWKLEKADPLVEVSDPKEPITYYLDHTVPEEYRAAVKDGILLWNSAFEKIGISNAIVVKNAPTDDPDWDSSDVRYSTVRWFVTTQGNFAIGPSHVDPYTGQIYDADIGFAEGMVRGAKNRYREEVDPVAAFNAAAREANLTAREGWSADSLMAMQGPVGSGIQALGQCGLASELSRHAAFGHALLTARGMIPGSPQEKQYIRDYLVHVTAHEVGHTLGLRHNYRASQLHPNGDIHDAAKTSKMGLVASVMDYTTVNIAPEGVPQGQYWSTTLGPYDYWAVEYAYSDFGAERPEDELDELAAIAEKSSRPELAYATDEDAMGFTAAPIGMDPRSHQWDLGADPIGYYTDRAKLSRELWSKLPGEALEDGEGFQSVRRAFNRGLFEYFPAIMSVSKYVGGVQHNRQHAGDPGDIPPYVPVPAEEQRRALKWFNDHLFSADAFEFSPEVVNRLAVPRFGNLSGFILLPRLDYPIHNTVLAIQNLALARLYHPALLDRVVDMETKVSGDYVDMAEVFGTLRDGIWSEIGPGSQAASINSHRRALQRRQLSYMVAIAKGDIADAPAEALTMARYDLMTLKDRIEGSIGRVTDEATKAHLAESKALIEGGLEASFLRS